MIRGDILSSYKEVVENQWEYPLLKKKSCAKINVDIHFSNLIKSS